MFEKIIISVILPFIIVSITFSQNQETLPVLKTNVSKLDVKEGDKLQKGIWELVPEIEVDVYEVQNKNIEQVITFYSDTDSLSFNVKPNSTYDFIILLNGKEKFRSRISTKYNTYRKDCNNCVITSDSIPFTVGRDNRMLIQGKVNDGEILNFLFDTGAEGNWLHKSGFKKMSTLKFHGQTISVGGGGQVNGQYSSGNKLQISDLIWDNKTIDYSAQQVANYDGGIGYKVFEDKVVEFNYDTKIMIIHNKMIELGKGFTRCNLKQMSGLYFIELSLQIGDRRIKGWFDFDTGNTGTLNISNDFATENNLHGSMTKIGDGSSGGVGPNTIKNDIVMLPKLLVGDYELSQLPIRLEQPSTIENVPFSIVGTDILKRFHVVIDYKNNAVYLKPNSLFGIPFKK